ncbi:MAG: hypothetical protein Hals2KO_11420 [Halioglobus sp.]
MEIGIHPYPIDKAIPDLLYATKIDDVLFATESRTPARHYAIFSRALPGDQR